MKKHHAPPRDGLTIEHAQAPKTSWWTVPKTREEFIIAYQQRLIEKHAWSVKHGRGVDHQLLQWPRARKP